MGVFRGRPRWLWLALGLGVPSVLLIGLALGRLWQLIIGDPYDRLVIPGEALTIRAIARSPMPALAQPGGVYEYEYLGTDSHGSWKPILRFRFGRPDPIPRGQVKFLGRGVAYLYHEFVFAVTTDGGRSWTIRGEPERSLDARYEYRLPRVDEVTIGPDGIGSMRVTPYPWQEISYRELSTRDFGRTWQPIASGR
jgi:hypothetical protein